MVPLSSQERWNTAARERGLETLFALQPSQEELFVAVERSHEIGDVGQRDKRHNKSRLTYIINLAMFYLGELSNLADTLELYD